MGNLGLVDLPFDGRIAQAVATFVPDAQILIGTNLLRAYYLQIKFASNMVRLDLE